MFTFLHAADIHLDSPLLRLDRYEGAPVEALRGATRLALENLVDLAVSRPVDFILIAGDVYDGDWKDYNTGLCFAAQMARLNKAGISVYMVSGNHDAASRMTRSLRLPPNVHRFPSDRADTVCLDDLGVAIHGQGFPTPAVKKNLAARYPEAVPGCFNIGLLHTCATGRDSHAPYAPCTVGDLAAKGYDYWALGHIHQREILSENPLVIFPGNIQGRHIRETGPKGCMVVEVDGAGRATPEFQPLDVIRWDKIRPDISHAADGYEVLSVISEELEAVLEKNDGLPLAVRLELLGRSPAHEALMGAPARWTSEIRSAASEAGGGQIWIEKIRFKTRPPARTDTPEAPDGPVGELIRYFSEAGADPEFRAAIEKSLTPLLKKLPRELRETTGHLRPDDPGWLDEMLENVRPLLLKRLASGGGEP